MFPDAPVFLDEPPILLDRGRIKFEQLMRFSPRSASGAGPDLRRAGTKFQIFTTNTAQIFRDLDGDGDFQCSKTSCPSL